MKNQINLDTIKHTMDTIAVDPELANASFSVSGEWQGGVKNRFTVGNFAPFYSDEPIELAGENTQPTPADYLLSGALACFMTSFEILATQENLQLDKVSARIEAEINLPDLFESSYFKKVKVYFSAESKENAEFIRAVAEKALKASPMMRSIRAEKTLIFS